MIQTRELLGVELLQENQTNAIAFSNNARGTQSQDILIGTAANESILGFGEDDIIVGKDGNDTLIGGGGNDSLASGRGNNLLLGQDGNDTLVASSYRPEETGNNVFNGGLGDDLLVGGQGNDLLSGAAGNDIVFGLGGRDNILGGNGLDIINGGAGNDRILGEGDTDSLEGGDGNDLIFGGNGSDILKGLEGFDTLNGGAAIDLFYLTPNTGRDLITDFKDGEDILVLESTDRFGSPLTFDGLSITQGNNQTIIKIAETSETLAILNKVAASAIDRNDFLESTEIESASEIMGAADMTELLSQIATHTITRQTKEVNRDSIDGTSNVAESNGSVTSQGVEIINADEARRRFGVDGSNVTIGILSDSFDRSLQTTVTASDDVATGDLPGADNPNGYNIPVSILDDSADNSFNSLPDEGRALAQIVSDVAPGAKILFQTAFAGANDFARGIDELVAAGADIIVDDIASVVEPFFQDGIVAQAANRAVDAGVAFFSSAGNDGRNSYEAEFRPVTDSDLVLPGLENYSFHDFNPGEAVDILQNITLQPGRGMNLSFQWDEPFASAGGRGASSDLDIFVLDRDNNLVDFGAESNVGTDAVERISVTNNTGAAAEYKLLIGRDIRAGGEAPKIVKYIDFSGGTSGAEYFTNSSTVFGHPNAEGVSAVGASSYQTPQQLESFSSVGVTSIFFNEQGDRLSEPELRQTPDLIAPNRVNTTFFVEGIDYENDGFPNFPGTSAASPHAAGVAALLLNAVPNATPQQIYGALEQTAIDLDNPFTSGFDTGFDTATGFGLIQADLALELLLT